LRVNLRGVIVPLITPFHENESLDEETLRRLCARLIESGVQGLFPIGSTGEFYALGHSERRRILKVVIDESRERVPVFAGVSAIDTGMAADFAREAEELGANALVALTPFYIQPSQEELYCHFRAITEATTLPVLAYNNPLRTRVNIDPKTLARLSVLQNFVGIKDSSGDLAQVAEYLQLASNGFCILQGQDGLLFDSLALGVSGGVLATANIAPDLVVGLYRAFIAGDTETCKQAQQKLVILRNAIQLATFPVVFKEAMSMVGFPVGPARRPATALDERTREELRRTIEAIGLLPSSDCDDPVSSGPYLAQSSESHS